MKRFLVALLAALLVAAVQGGILGRIFHRESTSTTTSTTTTTTEEPRRPFFINNNIPEIPKDCVAQFKCKKKLANVQAPKPCVKYCLHRITCPNNQTSPVQPNQCVDLDEQQVLAAHEANTEPPVAGQTTTEKTMMVAMIDFPCQPGYLPDHRGRCREIWWFDDFVTRVYCIIIPVKFSFLYTCLLPIITIKPKRTAFAQRSNTVNNLISVSGVNTTNLPVTTNGCGLWLVIVLSVSWKHFKSNWYFHIY